VLQHRENLRVPDQIPGPGKQERAGVDFTVDPKDVLAVLDAD